MTAPIRRLVLDVLKPIQLDSLELAGVLSECDGVDGVNVDLVETDKEVQNLKITIEGADIDSGSVETAIENLGGSVHSIDQVAMGYRLIEQTHTFQDP
ncbi:MAG: DUF211 domain-containing protein [Natronomonas sp.]